METKYVGEELTIEKDGMVIKMTKEEAKDLTKSLSRLFSIGLGDTNKDTPIRIRKWYSKFEEAKAFAEEKGHPPTQTHKLGGWVQCQRGLYKGKGGGRDLTGEQINLLEQIQGWFWEVKKPTWNENYELIKELGSIPYQGTRLGEWVVTQRLAYQGKGSCKKLTEEQIKLLEQIPGWYWNKNKKTKRVAWMKNYRLLKKCGIPKRLTTLGNWVSNQKLAYQGKGTGRKLNEEQIKLLEQIPGWYWTKERS